MIRQTLLVPADSPCLEGHFPGNPVVPAVVILEAVLNAAAQTFGGRVTGIAQSKFLLPLRPGECCVISFPPVTPGAAPGRPKFECHVDGQLVARGALVVAPLAGGLVEQARE